MTRKKHHENIVMFFCQKDVIFAMLQQLKQSYAILATWISKSKMWDFYSGIVKYVGDNI